MKQFCLALMIALLGTTSAYAVSASWSTASDRWAANGTFQTGFGATTTASFSVGVVFDVANLSTFNGSTLLLGVRNNSSVATDADRNTGPSFEVWGDGKIRTKASSAAAVTSGTTWFTYNDSYASGNNKATEYIGTANFSKLLHTGENAIGLTLELFQNESNQNCTTYTLYLNGTKVVTSTHTNILSGYNYQNLATLTGAEVYYMNGIASQADINSLPEPTALALLALGVAGVALRRKAA